MAAFVAGDDGEIPNRVVGFRMPGTLDFAKQLSAAALRPPTANFAPKSPVPNFALRPPMPNFATMATQEAQRALRRSLTASRFSFPRLQAKSLLGIPSMDVVAPWTDTVRASLASVLTMPQLPARRQLDELVGRPERDDGPAPQLLVSPRRYYPGPSRMDLQEISASAPLGRTAAERRQEKAAADETARRDRLHGRIFRYASLGVAAVGIAIAVILTTDLRPLASTVAVGADAVGEAVIVVIGERVAHSRPPRRQRHWPSAATALAVRLWRQLLR